ncbi:hypothetical protein ACIQI7_12945 [Kitasatospora sp. NPDC092039]|uniref:hypothetical protein n=1 Tax=Kitasatospora sp. NPDC092039 TaxID=3364086 RepID=UPI00382C6AD2
MVSWNDEHHDAVLADILLSRKIGVAHIRHLGDLISVRAQLSMGMQGPVGLTFARRAEIIEEVLELEDAYRSAWAAVAAESNIDQLIPKLEELEHSMESVVRGVREVARRNGIKIDCYASE